MVAAAAHTRNKATRRKIESQKNERTTEGRKKARRVIGDTGVAP